MQYLNELKGEDTRLTNTREMLREHEKNSTDPKIRKQCQETIEEIENNLLPNIKGFDLVFNNRDFFQIDHIMKVLTGITDVDPYIPLNQLID